MKILIAKDDVISRRLLVTRLAEWGHEVVVTDDGAAAWEVLRQDDGPSMAVLDWMMPVMDGVELCRGVRSAGLARSVYLILLTARSRKQDIVQGLEAGADDFIVKPFHLTEMRARVQVGVRVVVLEQSLQARVRQLEAALTRVKSLQGLLPICSYCKRIRDDGDYWHQVDRYIADNSEVQFSHGICPECFEKVVKPQLGDSDSPRLARDRDDGPESGDSSPPGQ